MLEIEKCESYETDNSTCQKPNGTIEKKVKYQVFLEKTQCKSMHLNGLK